MNEAGNHTDNCAEAVPAKLRAIDREIARLTTAKRPLRARMFSLMVLGRMRRDRAVKDGDLRLLDFVDRNGEYPTGFNYFISDGQFVKIGYSVRPLERLKGLQGQIGQELRILAQYPGTLRTERKLHSEFHELRVRGEWFRSDARLLAVIDAINGGALMTDAIDQNR